jgi:hypothetical protein
MSQFRSRQPKVLSFSLIYEIGARIVSAILPPKVTPVAAGSANEY